MPMAAEDIETLIRAALPDARIEITDLRGDGVGRLGGRARPQGDDIGTGRGRGRRGRHDSGEHGEHGEEDNGQHREHRQEEDGEEDLSKQGTRQEDDDPAAAQDDLRVSAGRPGPGSRRTRGPAGSGAPP